jgi:hypothetical protein
MVARKWGRTYLSRDGARSQSSVFMEHRTLSLIRRSFRTPWNPSPEPGNHPTASNNAAGDIGSNAAGDIGLHKESSEVSSHSDSDNEPSPTPSTVADNSRACQCILLQMLNPVNRQLSSLF